MRTRLFLILAAIPTAALAAPETPRHEYVDPAVLARFAAASPSEVTTTGGQATSIKRDGESLPAPDDNRKDAPELGDDGGRMARPSETRPDRNTQQDAALRYQVVFNPTVAPLRRNVVFDRVASDYRMSVGRSPRTAVRVGPPTPREGRELFWADIQVEGGRAAPIPSVAPDMGILSVRTEAVGSSGKRVSVTFEKDGADNFYARADHVGPVRLVMLVDADSGYFSAPLPGNVRLSAQAGKPHTQIPKGAKPHAERVLKTIDVRRDGPFDQEIDKLVTWFRAFEAGPPPTNRGDILVDLSLGKVGVCRHRAFAFTVLARAAGVPTRYAQNEAHAFVEIQTPEGRWRRVDLGGESPQLDIDGAENSTLHTPPADPFGKPEAYLSQYSTFPQAGEDESGATSVVNGAPPKLGQGGGEGASGTGAGGGPSADAFAPRVEVPLPRWPDDSNDETEASAGVAVTVALDLTGQREAFRGEDFPQEITGALRDDDAQPIAGLKVQVYLVAPSGVEAFPIGPAVKAGADGRFKVKVKLPAAMPLGGYRLVAATEGTEAYAPGRSDPDN